MKDVNLALRPGRNRYFQMDDSDTDVDNSCDSQNSNQTDDSIDTGSQIITEDLAYESFLAGPIEGVVTKPAARVGHACPSDGTGWRRDSDLLHQKSGWGSPEDTYKHLKFPKKNYSAHPNIKKLPGLDFDIADDAPFLSKKQSGLARHIFLPAHESQAGFSHEGLLNVATRIEHIMNVAYRIYDNYDGQCSTLGPIWYFTFQSLKGQHRSWDFKSSVPKLDTIFSKIIAARKAFLEKDVSMRHVHNDFRSFLRSLDLFIELIESTLALEAADTRDEKFVSNHKKRPRDDELDLPSVSAKKPRLVEENEAVASMSLEKQVEFWKEKCKNQEEQCKDYEKELKILQVENKRFSHTCRLNNWKWTCWMSQLWRKARPEINSGRKRQGKEDLGLGDRGFQDYLRSLKLDELSAAYIGMR